MCGIYGIMDFACRERQLDSLLARMARVVVHRGPDDAGQHIDPPIALGMRRLSIIDLTTGHQPITNEDGTVWIVMNGEIYNFRELRSKLEKKGHRFRSHTDTEVVVHLYEEHGAEFFRQLRGMFGLALWDVKREQLILGRDRLGEKPLYFRQETNRLLFASELKSILQIEDVPRRLNMTALREYLALGYVPAPLTLIHGVEKLLPGHYLVARQGRTVVHKYWDVPVDLEEACSEEEWVERVRAKLLETVRSQLVSDVPLGAFLSGGIDSSSIVAAMAAAGSGTVKTYAVGYDNKDSYYNELPYARTVATMFGTDHHEIVVRPDVTELLPQLIWHLDEPIADSASLTTFLVSRLARNSVKVILSGVGGDELFGGYRRYLGDNLQRWYRLLPDAIGTRFLPRIFGSIPKDRTSLWKDYVRYAASFTDSAHEQAASRYISYVTLLDDSAQRGLLEADLEAPGTFDGAAGRTLDAYFARWKDNGQNHSLNRTLYVDLKTSLPDDLLALTDRMSMAASVECRAPLVDYELVELASRIPAHFKVRGLKLKYLLKRAVAPWLPPVVIRRRKRGFGAPVGGWLRKELRPLMSELLSEEQVLKRGLFRWPALKKLITAHEQQQQDCTDHLFALIALEFWCRAYLDGADCWTWRSSNQTPRPYEVRQA